MQASTLSPFPHLTLFFFFFNDTATTEIYTLSLHYALPISSRRRHTRYWREWSSDVCRLLLENGRINVLTPVTPIYLMRSLFFKKKKMNRKGTVSRIVSSCIMTE